jgi:glutamyl-tRNA synthetase
MYSPYISGNAKNSACGSEGVGKNFYSIIASRLRMLYLSAKNYMSGKKIVTRFAPSPTGYLHIGGARTALFNYLFAKHHNGDFLLRIEDTDKKRSTHEAIDAIIKGMNWLGLNHDGEIVFQSTREARHAEVANELVKNGKAYKCYATAEQLQAQREEAEKNGQVFKYNKEWRDKSEAAAPAGVSPAIRIKAPLDGEITINDLVQGDVTVKVEDLDDMVILRADGTPTYMLAVVVDDHDMGVTHVVRGDDHLTNAFRQKLIYDAMGWEAPEFAHIPLIHGADGAKLSKRHGALGVEAYEALGYLPEAIINYLMRLGWSYGDDEIISLADAAKIFDIAKVGRSPSRFDFDKLNNINAHYMRNKNTDELFALLLPFLEQKFGSEKINATAQERIRKGLKSLTERADKLPDLAAQAEIYIQRVEYTEKAKANLVEGAAYITELLPKFEAINNWSEAEIKPVIENYATEKGLKLGKILPVVRSGICGTMEAPALFEVIEILGKEEVLKRLKNL